MSYILANTGNNLGRRGLGRMGWDNAPYTVYRQPRSMTRLNGEFTSAGADQGTNGHRQGSITYRIDPRTGQYNFYRTDIKPRGVFVQNTFQHPAPDTVTALGARVLPIGKSVSGSTLQQGRVSRGPMIALRPGITLSGLGCGSCGGRCNSPRRLGMRGLRGMGAADFPGSCGPQSDGSIIPCGPDTAGATEQGDVSLPGVTPVVVAPAPGQQTTSFESGTPSIPGVTFFPNGIAFSSAPRPGVTQPQSPSWFNQSSSIGGAAIPNSFLAIGGALFAALVMEGSKGKRR